MNTPKSTPKVGWGDKKWKVVLIDRSGHEMIEYGKTYNEVWEKVAYSENFDVDETTCYIYERLFADKHGNKYDGDFDAGLVAIPLSKPKTIAGRAHYYDYQWLPPTEMGFHPRWVLYEVMYGETDQALINQMIRENFDPRDYI